MTKEEAWDAAKQGLDVQHLAHKLGVTSSAVYAWAYVPKERLRAVSYLLRLPPEQLRPDLFPPEPWSAL